MGYISPVGTRYGTEDMTSIFTDYSRHTLWRLLWVSLAKAQAQVGINISDEQIEEMYKNGINIDYERIAEIEKTTKHDVMAHIQEFGERCPKAKPIIHLGMTSCDIVDNTDVILIATGIKEVRRQLVMVIESLVDLADRYKITTTVGYTHLQKAQMTTVGRRVCTWIQDLMMDMELLDNAEQFINLRGLGGAVGTQASFMKLINRESYSMTNMEDYFIASINELAGLYLGKFSLVTQTYPRKMDTIILNVLASISQSATKFATDVRLLQGLGEMGEGFEDSQVGSSAMPYKKNPINCEKICSLSRIVQSHQMVAIQNASNQWLERSLDDSANRRVIIPESFIILSEILKVYDDVAKGIVIDRDKIADNIYEHENKAIMEDIMMKAVENGGDRQNIHGRIKIYVTQNPKTMVDYILSDDDIPVTRKDVIDILDDSKIGRAFEQTYDYIDTVRVVLRNWEGENRNGRDEEKE